VQLTQKKTALQFKALDQTLQMMNRSTGEKVANNHRCQELDKIVPSLMGVSKVGDARSFAGFGGCLC
jgi:DNA repair protein RAD50